MKDHREIDTCMGYGDGIDVFWSKEKIREAQEVVNEECESWGNENQTVVVVLDIPTRRASLDEDGIAALKSVLDEALAAHRERTKDT